MKNYNKILEAVNRGIRFALDDFEDNELQGQTSAKVNNTSNLREYLEWQQLIDKFKNQNINKKDLLRIVELYKLLNLKYTVNSKDKLKDIIQYICNINDKINLNWIDTSHLEDMSGLFEYSSFDGDISEWDVSNVIDMNGIFKYSPFNQDISNWNISVNCYRHNMFDNCPIKHKYMPGQIRKYYDYE